MWLLKTVFRQLVTHGAVTFVAPNGERSVIRGANPGPEVVL